MAWRSMRSMSNGARACRSSATPSGSPPTGVPEIKAVLVCHNETATGVPEGFDGNQVVSIAYHRYNLSLGAGLS